MAQVQRDRDMAQAELEKRALQLQGEQALTHALRSQLEQERAGRLQAEKMADAGRAELVAQREHLQAELNRTQTGFAAAIVRP